MSIGVHIKTSLDTHVIYEELENNTLIGWPPGMLKN